MHGYCCTNRTYRSACTTPLVLVLTTTSGADIVCSIVACVTFTSCHYPSVPTANTLPSILAVVLVAVWLGLVAFCIINIVTSYEF